MDLRVERDALVDAVMWAARSLPARPPMPVLLGLLLEVDEDAATLAVSGFDYEVSARASVPVTVGEPGRALVNGRLLADIVRALPAATVQLRLDGGRVVVSCGSARFTLPAMQVEDYPALPEMPAAAGRLESDVFAAAVAAVALAASRFDTLPMLTGVRVEIEGEQITLAATDKYRLAVRTLGWHPDLPGLSTAALVPARTLADTAKALTGAEVTLALASGGGGESMIGFEAQAGGASKRMTSRLIEGEFPKYRSLLPSEAAFTAEVAVGPFVEAVRRVQLVSLVAARNAPVVRLAFSGDGLVLRAGGNDEPEASEQLSCGWEGGEASAEPFEIAFNPAYLLDGLSSLDSDTAVLSFTGPARPAVITGKHEGSGLADAAHRYLIMPVKLSS